METQVVDAFEDLTVVDLRLNREWDLSMLSMLFVQRDIDLILQIPLSTRITIDQWMWSLEAKGNYSIKSATKVIQVDTTPAQIESTQWKGLW